MLYAAATFRYVFDYQGRDVYWCTADVGWITGHTYVVYAPLANAATSVLVRIIDTDIYINTNIYIDTTEERFSSRDDVLADACRPAVPMNRKVSLEAAG